MLSMNSDEPGILVVQLPNHRWYWEAQYHTKYGAMYHTSGESDFMFGAMVAAWLAHIMRNGY